MREIKFRYYDTKHNIMLDDETNFYGLADTYPNDEYYQYDEDWSPSILQILITQIRNDERFIAMQYTGLKDKNGVEIYEGDRVEFPKGFHADKKGENAYRHYLIDEVVFTNGAFHFKKEHMTISFDIDKAEIIGNIHNDSQR